MSATRTLIRGNGLKREQLLVEPPPIGSLVRVHGWGRIRVLPPRPKNVPYGIVVRHAAVGGTPSCVVESEAGSAVVPAAMLLPRALMAGTMTVAWSSIDTLSFSGRGVTAETVVVVIRNAALVRSQCAMHVVDRPRRMAVAGTLRHNDIVETPYGLAVMGGEGYAMTSEGIRVPVDRRTPVVLRPEEAGLVVNGWNLAYLPDGSVRIGCQHISRFQLMELAAEVTRHYADACRVAASAEKAFLEIRTTPTRKRR